MRRPGPASSGVRREPPERSEGPGLDAGRSRIRHAVLDRAQHLVHVGFVRGRDHDPAVPPLHRDLRHEQPELERLELIVGPFGDVVLDQFAIHPEIIAPRRFRRRSATVSVADCRKNLGFS